MSEEIVIPPPHAEAAKILIEKLQALAAEIPRFTPPGRDDAKKLSAVASVPDTFLESASVAVERSSRLETAAAAKAMTVRDAYGFALAFDPAARAAFALARAIAHTVRVQKANAGASALDVYAMAQRIASGKDGAELLPLVEDMRRKLGRKRVRKTTSQPAPAPDVTPAPKK